MDYIDDLYRQLFEAFNAKYGDCEAKVKAILREAFPWAEASRELAVIEARKVASEYDPWTMFSSEDNQRARIALIGLLAAYDRIASRPAPTAEKALREALDVGFAFGKWFATFTGPQHISPIAPISPEEWLIAHEAPKEAR